jgi:hypothetical protein
MCCLPRKKKSHAIYELLLIFYILVLVYDAIASPLKIHIMKKNTAIIHINPLLNLYISKYII